MQKTEALGGERVQRITAVGRQLVFAGTHDDYCSLGT